MTSATDDESITQSRAEEYVAGADSDRCDLSASADDQLIFETLNDRGTPLFAPDLIKRRLRMRCCRRADLQVRRISALGETVPGTAGGLAARGESGGPALHG
jgi:hypothetical protein